MDVTGIVFDIKELAVFDGPGIRTTVFLKGCPMRCKWCHNPEGLTVAPQLMVSGNGCLKCGRCREACPTPEKCIACGTCVHVCPLRLRRIAGTRYTVEELAKRLLKDKDILEMNGGGITLSGGEPTAQPVFVRELLKRTKELHRAIETCGYCDPKIFAEILAELDYVQMDIKLVDPEEHRKWTGCDNARILANLEQVKTSGLPAVIRVPLIPGVNDTDRNLEQTAALVKDMSNLERVELLPYHQTAGAKYEMVGMTYDPGFDTEAAVNKKKEIFEAQGIPVLVL